MMKCDAMDTAGVGLTTGFAVDRGGVHHRVVRRDTEIRLAMTVTIDQNDMTDRQIAQQTTVTASAVVNALMTGEATGMQAVHSQEDAMQGTIADLITKIVARLHLSKLQVKQPAGLIHIVSLDSFAARKTAIWPVPTIHLFPHMLCVSMASVGVT